MKKLFGVLFCALVVTLTGCVNAPFKIDPVATANAPWKVGEKIVKEGTCDGADYYREFLGITQSGFALVQNFYLSGEKFSDPFLMTFIDAQKNTERPCWEGIAGGYTQRYKSGQKQSEGNFENGGLEGLLVIWYENGQKQAEMHIKNGKEFGLYRAWDEQGNLIEEKDFGTPED